MRMPSVKTPARSLVSEWGLFLEARLGAKPETRSLHEEWVVEQGRLREGVGRLDESRERTVRAQAEVTYRETELVGVVRRVSSAVKVDVDGRGLEYERIFRMGLSAYANLSNPVKVAEAREIESRIAESEGLPTAKAILPEFAAARTAFEGALAASEGAKAHHKRTRMMVSDRVADWHAAYRRIYGEIVSRFPRERSVRESFFRRVRSRAPEAAEPSAGAGEGPAEVVA